MKTTILVDNLKFPEGPRWRAGKLWFCDLFARQVMVVDLHGEVQTVVELTDTPTAAGWTPEGQLLVVSATARRLLSLENGKLVEVAVMSGIAPYPCNDMVVDGQGESCSRRIRLSEWHGHHGRWAKPDCG